MLRLVLDKVTQQIKYIGYNNAKSIENLFCKTLNVFIWFFENSEFIDKTLDLRFSQIRRVLYVVIETVFFEIHCMNTNNFSKVKKYDFNNFKVRTINQRLNYISNFYYLFYCLKHVNLVFIFQTMANLKIKNCFKMISGEYKILTPCNALFKMFEGIFLNEGIMTELAN